MINLFFPESTGNLSIIRDGDRNGPKKDNLNIDRATISIDLSNIKSKIINEQLSKITEDLIKIQKKRKDVFGQ